MCISGMLMCRNTVGSIYTFPHLLESLFLKLQSMWYTIRSINILFSLSIFNGIVGMFPEIAPFYSAELSGNW